ncbi:MAG TPA: arginine--tRNA ligase [Methanoregulaceae archaeon]|nr:arginine--tRNA ligase [Methanoregulaceae archaeon]
MFLETYETIEKAIRSKTRLCDVLLTTGGEHADLTTTASFVIAKEQKTNPAAIAASLVDELKSDPELSGITIEAKGPYINFLFGPDYISETLKIASKPGYGNGIPKMERVVLEHTSANPNGPLHVGHIRNSIIGDTLARCFRKAGYKLEVQYYVNDMGRQIAIVVWGFDHLDTGVKEEEKSDHYVARIYIAANRELEKDPEKVAEVDSLMREVEKSDPGTVKRFRSAVSTCLDGFYATLARLNVHHDRFVWESDFVRNGDTERFLSRVYRLPEYHDDDKVWLDLTEFGFDKEYVLRRSDGTSVYAARDLAYHVWKGRNFDRVIDVLGADHKLIGAQLRATLKLVGERAPDIVHFEFVSLPEGSMSTRAGKFVSADELLDEVTRQAFSEVTVRRPELGEDQRYEIARSVALGAIRYDIVKVSPEKSTVFDWKEALDFERQSGPYIQYAHARAASILEKAGEFEEAYLLTDPHGIALAKHIARYPAVIQEVVTELKPHALAIYARELADLFNAFYHYEPVLKSEGITRQSRLTLVRAAKNTLKESLETLGIDALCSM